MKKLADKAKRISNFIEFEMPPSSAWQVENGE